MDLALYRVDGRGRIALAGVVADGVEFYTAERAEDGKIVLSPVRVVTTALKRDGSIEPVVAPAEPANPDGVPWGKDDE